ncbi:MAG: class I SAM-dependent methyltransferase [Actinomycetota bacterium]|nr:class I SAM-dependent methyltransferase [Actinomycetota bacterium]
MVASAADEINRLRDEVEGVQWYHTFELAPGLETPGWFDLRNDVAKLPLPSSLEGKRCLDIGTFDGFWAFEMERRGAEVLAIDIIDPAKWDWPAGAEQATIDAISQRKRGGNGFELVKAVLGSKVTRRDLSVYDLDPSDVGTFDFVYLGSLLLHLRDPVRALSRVRDVCAGTFVLCDAIDVAKTVLFPREPVASLEGRGRPWWWRPNVAALERVVEAAGFASAAPTRRLRLTPGAGQPPPKLSGATLRSRVARQQIAHARFGDPHAIIEARPA